MLLNCGVGEDSWESLGLQGDPISQSKRKSVLNIHWKDGCWSWSSNPLTTGCKELTRLKRPWCWARLKAGGEGDNRGCDGWIPSPTNGHEFEQLGAGDGLGSLVCFSPWDCRVGHDWATELNWTEPSSTYILILFFFFFSVPGFNPVSHVIFSCHFSLITSNLWQFLVLPDLETF